MSTKLLSKSITCVSCERRQLIANTELIQTHWYEGPHGCTGGDTWHPGECQFVCGHCGVLNRLLTHPEWDERAGRYVDLGQDFFLQRYKPRFKQVTDVYDRAMPGQFANNRWISVEFKRKSGR